MSRLSLLALALALQPLDDQPTPRWDTGVASVVQRRCAGCHRPGGDAPFALDDAAAVAQRSHFVAAVVKRGLMPPWLPDSAGLPLRDDGRLSDDERERLLGWLAAGAPGAADLQATTATEVGAVGESASAISLSLGPWLVPAEGADDMRSFAVPFQVDQPRWISGLKLECNEPTALHSASFLADVTGTAALLDDASPLPGYDAMGDLGLLPSGALGAVGVGARSLQLPSGFAFRLPAQGHLVAELHARPIGRPLQLTCRLDLLPSEDALPRAVVTLTQLVTQIDVAPGERVTLSDDALVLPCAVDLLGLLPRAGAVCTRIEVGVVRAHEPDASPPTETRVLSIPRWDSHYRRPLLLQQPLRLQPGDRLVARWFLDNREDNLANPSSPPARVQLGPEPTDELLAVQLWVSPVSTDDEATLQSFLMDTMMRRMESRTHGR